MVLTTSKKRKLDFLDKHFDLLHHQEMMDNANKKNRRVNVEIGLQGYKQTDRTPLMQRFVDNVSRTNYMN